MKIFKYELEIMDFQEIRLPRGAKILHIGGQHYRLFIWAMVDEDAETHPRWFEIIGTGHRMPERKEYDRKFLATTILPPFVWHVFELTER